MDRPQPPAKNKLLLLYTFSSVGAMTNQQTMRFIIDNDLMDYVDLQLSLAELTDGDFLQMLPVEENRFYTLTSRAQQTLAFFKHLIPASQRETIDAQATSWRTLFQRERQLSSSYTKNASGDYSVHLVAREWGSTLINIQMGVATLYQAKALCKNWDGRASASYRALLEVLLREDPLAPPPPQHHVIFTAYFLYFLCAIIC